MDGLNPTGQQAAPPKAPCHHDSTRVDGTLDAHCLRCGENGYWHDGHRHDEAHPSGKVLLRVDCQDAVRLGLHCPMCGAEPGEPCTVISGTGNQQPGSRRPQPHFYRLNDHAIAVPVKDEPDWQAFLAAGVSRRSQLRREGRL